MIILARCGLEKPDYVNHGDYEYLEGEGKKILLVHRLEIDNIDKRYDSSSRIREMAIGYPYELWYRRSLARELYRLGGGEKLWIDFHLKADFRNKVLVKYMKKDYPESTLRNYDLILEVDMRLLLYFNLSSLNVLQTKTIDLWSMDREKRYLSSLTRQVYQGVGGKVFLMRNPVMMKALLENLMNRSAEDLAKYLLNIEQEPSREDITPYLPGLD